MLLITTSWDDGHKLDLRLANLLDKYGLKGTFYISQNYCNENVLSIDEILTISKNHEIGAHTINHPNLTKISASEAEEEIVKSKYWVESIIKKPVEMFCYPFGAYNDQTVELVKKAGFIGARMTEKFKTNISDPYQMGVTLQAYPFPFRKLSAQKYYWRYILQPIRQNFKGIRKFNVPIVSLRNWSSFSKALFDNIKNENATFHLFGHSWEIDKYNMWGELEDFIYYISKFGNSEYITNGMLIKKYKNEDRIFI